MPAPCVIDEGTIFEDFSTVEDWTKIDNNAYSPSVYNMSLTPGGYSLMGSLASTTTITMSGYYKTINHAFTAGERAVMVLDFYQYPDFSMNTLTGGTAKVGIQFSSTTDFSKAFTYVQPSFAHFGWNRMYVGVNDWSNVGGEDWANTMIGMRVTLTPIFFGLRARTMFDQLQLGVQTAPAVVMRFDDSYDSTYTKVKPKFDALGWKGTIDIVTDNVGLPNYLTQPHLVSLIEDDWELTQYSTAHPSIIYLSTDDMIADIRDQGIWFASLGYPTTLHYGYARSVVDNRLLEVLHELGFQSAALCYNWRSSMKYAATPIVEPYGVEGVIVGLNSAPSLATAKTWIDRIKLTGESLVMYFHDIGGANEMTEADFDDFCDYIVAQDIDHMTTSEWYGFARDPADAGWRSGGITDLSPMRPQA